MRTDKELFQVVLDNFDEFFRSSLCLLFKTLLDHGLLYRDERDRLDVLILRHPRRNSSKHWPYIWPRGIKEPRKKWLLKQLNKKP